MTRKGGKYVVASWIGLKENFTKVEFAASKGRGQAKDGRFCGYPIKHSKKKTPPTIFRF